MRPVWGVDRLRNGCQIPCWTHHHKAMAALKKQLGDPRPDGATLSLAHPDSSDAYWGYRMYRGRRDRYRLSTNPKDYVWESIQSNLDRRPRQQFVDNGKKNAGIWNCKRWNIDRNKPCVCGRHE